VEFIGSNQICNWDSWRERLNRMSGGRDVYTEIYDIAREIPADAAVAIDRLHHTALRPEPLCRQRRHQRPLPALGQGYLWACFTAFCANVLCWAAHLTWKCRQPRQPAETPTP